MCVIFSSSSPLWSVYGRHHTAFCRCSRFSAQFNNNNRKMYSRRFWCVRSRSFSQDSLEIAHIHTHTIALEFAYTVMRTFDGARTNWTNQSAKRKRNHKNQPKEKRNEKRVNVYAVWSGVSSQVGSCVYYLVQQEEGRHSTHVICTVEPIGNFEASAENSLFSLSLCMCIMCVFFDFYSCVVYI